MSNDEDQQPTTNHRNVAIDDIDFASDFAGEDGGEKIQNCIHAASADDGRSTVVVGSEGPDEGKWIISKTVTIPSHTTLILVDAQIRLADNTNDNIFRNEQSLSGDETRDTQIHIVGVGKTRLDGNARNQNDDADVINDYRRNGIDLHKVDNFSIQDISIGPTNSYCISPEDVTNGYISNVMFFQDGSTRNQDAINVGGPAKDIQITDVRGRAADGPITIASRGTATSHKPMTAGADVRNIHVENAIFEGISDRVCGIIHTWPHDEATLEHIRIHNIVGRDLGLPAIRTGHPERTATTTRLHRDIVVSNVYAEGQGLCELRCDVGDLTIENAYLENYPTFFWTGGNRADGLTIVTSQTS